MEPHQLPIRNDNTKINAFDIPSKSLIQSQACVEDIILRSHLLLFSKQIDQRIRPFILDSVKSNISHTVSIKFQIRDSGEKYEIMNYQRKLEGLILSKEPVFTLLRNPQQ